MGRAGIVVAWIPAVLLLDRHASHGVERLLGVGSWLLLAAMLVGEAPRVRAQVAVVVGFATAVEYTFSVGLHTYVYRLHDVPWFVPPGHGLVYLGALSVGRSRWLIERRRVLISLTVALGGGYALWGLLLSGRRDVLGAVWFVCLVAFLARARQPTVFVGAFVIVTYLELLGTHLGIWTWQLRAPIAHAVSMGNPPSGAAGGYGFFDAAAIAFAPRVERLVERLLSVGRRGERPQDVVVQQPVAAHHTAAVSGLDP